ncbi:AfsR/SARP family transcriptional regulator [Dactylosporangium sp. NPDC005555]|uniref:AfsR/SARP family transcriptional regulator n=1 Tax=Dactylosporangium sp. NPDC005555 TaxID=3154889 RepID=UPI0033BC5799
MELRVLGRMEAEDSGGAIELGPPKQRLALATLLLHAGEAVSTDSLVDVLWGDQPPASARQNVHLHIHRLRRALGAERLVTRGRMGYRLLLSRGDLDAYRFVDLVDEAQQASDHGRAAVLIREALAEWRGGAFADFHDHPVLVTEVARLAELRLQAVEYRNDVDLVVGDHLRLVGRLRPLVAEHPYRERLHEQLILALYRSGRSFEALEAFQDVRRILVDDLGLDPGAHLRELEKRILDRDPDL